MSAHHIVIRPLRKQPVPFVAVSLRHPNEPGTPHQILEGAAMPFPKVTIDTTRELLIGSDATGDKIFPLGQITYTLETKKA